VLEGFGASSSTSLPRGDVADAAALCTCGVPVVHRIVLEPPAVVGGSAASHHASRVSLGHSVASSSWGDSRGGSGIGIDGLATSPLNIPRRLVPDGTSSSAASPLASTKRLGSPRIVPGSPFVAKQGRAVPHVSLLQPL
jgi:hypothetical protein